MTEKNITDAAIAVAVKRALKDAGIKAFITDANISIVMPDGRTACYRPLQLDTEK